MFGVHITRIYPENSCMEIGGLRYDANGNWNKEIPTRITLHWALNKISNELAFMTWDTSISYNFDTYASEFIIIEPFDALSEEFADGTVEDFFTVGRHVLSDKAIILAPNTQIFPDSRVHYYDSTSYPPNKEGREKLLAVYLSAPQLTNEQFQERLSAMAIPCSLTPHSKSVYFTLETSCLQLYLTGIPTLKLESIKFPDKFQSTLREFLILVKCRYVTLCSNLARALTELGEIGSAKILETRIKNLQLGCQF